MGKSLLGLALVFCSITVHAKIADISITSFNIKMFGDKSKMESLLTASKRDKLLKKFISEQIPKSDLFVFQEIIDVKRFIDNVVPTELKCMSYHHPNPKHQNVVLCRTDRFEFKPEPLDPDSVIEEIGYNGRLRPALHTLVTDKDGKSVMRLIGVHLKAMPSESLLRQEQITTLAKFLNGLKSNVPVVLTGDFNSFPAAKTGQSTDDSVFFDNILNVQAGLQQASAPDKFTYRTPWGREKFDRFWISKTITQSEGVEVYPVCNDDSTILKDFEDPQFYYDFISDHCPVTLNIQVQVTD